MSCQACMRIPLPRKRNGGSLHLSPSRRMRADRSVLQCRRLVSSLALAWLATVVVTGQTAAQTAAPAVRQGDLKAISHTLEALSEQVAPAVVQVFAVGYSLPDGSTGDDKSLLSQERSTGSGVIVD